MPGDDGGGGAELSQGLLDQIFVLWVDPELRGRSSPLTRNDLWKVLVVMPPAGPVKVLLNDEVAFTAEARAARPIEAGALVAVDDLASIEALQPTGIDPDVGWVGFVRLRDTYTIAFDFRRNKRKAAQLVERAREFLLTARTAYAAGHLGPAVENAFAAAELAVKAQLMVVTGEQIQNHQELRRRWADWTELGNAPTGHSRALARLAKERVAARYVDRALTLSEEHVEGLLRATAGSIELAQEEIEGKRRVHKMRWAGN